MNWTSDPGEPWVAIYRILIVLLMILSIIVSARAHQRISENRSIIDQVVPTVSAVIREGGP